jgi:hypothetical protein
MMSTAACFFHPYGIESLIPQARIPVEPGP